MQKEDTWVHSACEMCMGGCGILVHRVDGVVTGIKGDPDCPNGRGKICSKGLAGVMSLYDPNRVKTLLRRTNPEKGLGVDPGWVPISWDEAMDILEEKLAKVRKEDPRKLVLSDFDPSSSLGGVLKPWVTAFGTPNNHWGGYYCGNYLHASMYLINGTFHCDFDAEYINYLMLFGNQAGFGAGLNPNITAQAVATGRKRGLKVVVVDPICNQAGSKADEWVPIRPGTDGALALGMINVLLNELGIYDREFLKKHTNGPYLVKPDGYYARREGKPLVWDAKEGTAKTYDANVEDYAIEGSYVVDGVECTTAFQLRKEHAKKYTPEMVAEITTVPAATVRHLAEDFGKAARIGSTIVVDGVELPYRPVAANIYRGAGAHKHGTATSKAVLTLNMIVGAFYVPGGHRGTQIVGPSWEWGPGEYDGLITPSIESKGRPFPDYYTYKVKSPENTDLRELFPISTNRSPMNLGVSLDPEKYKLPYVPEVLLVCRRNLFLGGCDYELTAKALRNYKFIAAFCTHLDEMADFADLVLPEAMYLEKLQCFPGNDAWGHTAQTGYFYWGIRQPVVPPAGEARDWCDALIDLADRLGFLGDVYEVCNRQYELTEPYKLDPSGKYTKEEIADRRYKSRFGEEKGLDWFKKNGWFSFKRKVDEMFPLPWLKPRFPLYYENIIGAGVKVKEVTESMGLKDWDVSDYEPMGDWNQCASYTLSGDFDLIVCNYRVPTHNQSITPENPWLAEISELNPYAQKIMINTKAAKRKGIRDKDRICVESAVGKVVGEAKVTECIHPETIGISSHFGSFAKGKPVAYGKGCNFNKLIPYDTDPISTGVDACVKVKVYRV
ncbi:molybdopterin-dependent oxidoreductase [Chloroflexota bacterium]